MEGEGGPRVLLVPSSWVSASVAPAVVAVPEGVVSPLGAKCLWGGGGGGVVASPRGCWPGSCITTSPPGGCGQGLGRSCLECRESGLAVLQHLELVLVSSCRRHCLDGEFL